MSRGLDRFPESFSAAAFQAARNEEKLREARALVLERYTKFVQAEKPYFQIDLTNYPEEVRKTVITEISQRFQGIGYRAPPPQKSDREMIYDEMINIVMQRDSRTRGYVNASVPKEVRCKVIRLKNSEQAGNFTHFFIALTEQANRELETYTWVLK